jgi:hypothetical protein
MSCVGCYWASELAAVNWAGATAGVLGRRIGRPAGLHRERKGRRKAGPGRQASGKTTQS